MTIATWNPADKSSLITLSGGDLTATSDGSSNGQSVRATQFRSTGKWYCEITANLVVDSLTIGSPYLGLTNASYDVTAVGLVVGENAHA